MNPLAQELNQKLQGTAIEDLLSDFGRRIFFPRGIVAQSSEAARDAHRFNVTVGMAFHEGQPIHLESIGKQIPELAPSDIVPYVTTSGDPGLRDLWKKEMIRKNPDLAGKLTSLPIVVSGITHALATVADLFADVGDTVILPDLFWGNYRLIFEERKGSRVVTFPLFHDDAKINLTAFEETLRDQIPRGKCLVLLNFPNNPTGYAPSKTEGAEIVRIIADAADSGMKIGVITDDAYFGLFYEDNIFKQSLFASLADLHPNILAIKSDGATKEDYSWGFRLGFITFGGQGLTEEHYNALIQKTMGCIRSSVSNCSRVGQSLLIGGLNSGSYQQEKQKAFELIKAKYSRVRRILADTNLPRNLQVLPFNSGYFMCFEMKNGLDAEKLRRSLLQEKGIGTVSIGDKYLRVAYSMLDVDDLDELYESIFATAEKLA